VKRRGGTPLVELSVATDRIGGAQHLDVDPATLQLLDDGSRRTEPAVRTRAEYELLGEIILNLAEVVERERVAVPPPPVGEDAVGQHDDVARLLLAVHDDPPEAVVLKPRHAEPLPAAGEVDFEWSLDRRARLDPWAIGVGRLLVLVVLDHGCRRLRALALVEQVPELLVEALLTPPLPTQPPLVTHLHHLRASGHT
jgi:hypothetical protein